MTKLEIFADASPYVNRDRAVQELIKLLVEAVLTLPNSEKRRVIDATVTPLFDALLTLKKAKKVSRIGLIWMELICSGYQDHARRLWPPRTALSKKTAPDAPEAPDMKETPNVS
jgi:hypothetical protein